MIIAIHQPNFIPWLPFFAKMDMADIFILMINCQFEKNGYQNRCNVWDKWWTKPVKKGNRQIKEKLYTDGQKLYDVNIHWILAIARTLGIDVSKVHLDFETKDKGTERIISICRWYNCNKYLTNQDAVKKYLDESLLNKSGIDLVPFNFSHNIHVFEAFDRFGIDGTVKLLKKENEKCKT